MRDLIEPFRRHLQDRHAPRTIATYVQVAMVFANARTKSGPSEVSRSDVETFLGRARRGGIRPAPSTRNQELAALRSLARFAVRSGAWLHDPTVEVPWMREAARAPMVLSASEVRRLLEAAARCPSPWRRARDLALVAVLAECALRVHEVVALDVNQFDLATWALTDVLGKGGTRHDVDVAEPVTQLLLAWLAVRDEGTHCDEAALFVSQRGDRLSIRAVQHLVRKLGIKIGSKRHMHPHAFRHTAATTAISLGIDLPTVAAHLRHGDVRVTMGYIKLASGARREAARRLGTLIPTSVLPRLTSPPDLGESPQPDVRDIVQGPISPENDRLDVQRALGDMSEAA